MNNKLSFQSRFLNAVASGYSLQGLTLGKAEQYSDV